MNNDLVDTWQAKPWTIKQEIIQDCSGLPRHGVVLISLAAPGS